MVELAIMMPFLLVVILSIVDLGLLIRNHQILQNAAREGARYAVQRKNWINDRNPDGAGAESRIKNRVVNYCAGEGLDITPGDVTVDQNQSILVGGVSVGATRITVAFQYSFITPGASNLAGGPVSMTGEAVFRNLF